MNHEIGFKYGQCFKFATDLEALYKREKNIESRTTTRLKNVYEMFQRGNLEFGWKTFVREVECFKGWAEKSEKEDVVNALSSLENAIKEAIEDENFLDKDFFMDSDYVQRAKMTLGYLGRKK